MTGCGSGSSGERSRDLRSHDNRVDTKVGISAVRLLAFHPNSEVIHSSEHRPGFLAEGAYIHGDERV